MGKKGEGLDVTILLGQFLKVPQLVNLSGVKGDAALSDLFCFKAAKVPFCQITIKFLALVKNTALVLLPF
ncbi:hypothetical protein H5410_024211 [Solanum commersonii]|uniref:Uncharacterized protein n=1 Tax=Solanum commersonii TaxID=4109 RepID=A0A9J5ZLB7_SOLCO|nr:hypothetical protein H5410_024211 [Solanum commersonii]